MGGVVESTAPWNVTRRSGGGSSKGSRGGKHATVDIAGYNHGGFNEAQLLPPEERFQVLFLRIVLHSPRRCMRILSFAPLPLGSFDRISFIAGCSEEVQKGRERERAGKNRMINRGPTQLSIQQLSW